MKGEVIRAILSMQVVLCAADLDRLDAVVRMKLSKLLDPAIAGSDWRELATQLGFSQLIGVFELQKNPTRTLLDNYEVSVLYCLIQTCVHLQHTPSSRAPSPGSEA